MVIWYSDHETEKNTSKSSVETSIWVVYVFVRLHWYLNTQKVIECGYKWMTFNTLILAYFVNLKVFSNQMK